MTVRRSLESRKTAAGGSPAAGCQLQTPVSVCFAMIPHAKVFVADPARWPDHDRPSPKESGGRRGELWRGTTSAVWVGKEQDAASVSRRLALGAELLRPGKFSRAQKQNERSFPGWTAEGSMMEPGTTHPGVAPCSRSSRAGPISRGCCRRSGGRTPSCPRRWGAR